jgi:hypothetical protein
MRQLLVDELLKQPAASEAQRLQHCEAQAKSTNTSSSLQAIKHIQVFQKDNRRSFDSVCRPTTPRTKTCPWGPRGRAANFAQDDTVFLMRTSETGR